MIIDLNIDVPFTFEVNSSTVVKAFSFNRVHYAYCTDTNMDMCSGIRDLRSQIKLPLEQLLESNVGKQNDCGQLNEGGGRDLVFKGSEEEEQVHCCNRKPKGLHSTPINIYRKEEN
ncbi:hypothetical protein V6N12_039229 [Hibiscus sabdariffa]|uniref:Uncharacterized protein n=1 Tax=Hibiscus sabdariffa TaxID=183260 RepID=A0ABR2E0M3_9ROSI